MFYSNPLLQRRGRLVTPAGFKTSFDRGKKKGSCINPDIDLKSLREAAKLFSIQDDAIGNQMRALFSLHSSYQWQKLCFALMAT